MNEWTNEHKPKLNPLALNANDNKSTSLCQIECYVLERTRSSYSTFDWNSLMVNRYLECFECCREIFPPNAIKPSIKSIQTNYCRRWDQCRKVLKLLLYLYINTKKEPKILQCRRYEIHTMNGVSLCVCARTNPDQHKKRIFSEQWCDLL